VSIHFLFTKNSLIGSKLIRWGLGERSSHFAIGFDLSSGNRGVIFHSNFHGLGIAWAKDFLAKNEVVYELEPVLGLKLESEERLYQAIVKNYGKPYDYKGFLFFAFSAIWNKITGKKISKTNPWADSKALLCTEVAEAISFEIKGIFLAEVPITYGALSPDKLYFSLRTSKLLKEKFQDG
jgi:hypothetical protein